MAALGLGLSSCSSDPTPQGSGQGSVEPAHLVLVLASDLRADLEHPFASGLQPAYAPSSLAVQSAAAIFTGRLPSRAGAIGLDEAQPPPSAPTLPVWLRQQGYSTAWFSQSAWGSREGFTRGFDWVETAPPSGWTAAQVASRFDTALADLLAPGTPPAFVAMQLDAPLEVRAEDLETGREPDAWRAAYTEGATTVLDRLEAMTDQVRAAAAAADRPVVFVVAGLSGFDLGEHDGGIGSGWTMHEASIRVPFLARRLDGDSVATAFEAAPLLPPSLVDVTPSLLTFAGAEALAEDPELFDGSSWATIEGRRASWRAAPSDQPRIAELVVRERSIVRAVIAEGSDGLLKYVRASRAVPVEDRPALLRGYEEIQAAMLSGAVATPELFGPADEEATYLLVSGDGALPDRVPNQVTDDSYRPLQAALRRYADATARTGYEPLALTRRLEIDPDDLRDLESLGYL